MIYNPSKIKKLISNTENYLNPEDLMLIREFLWQYNKMYLITKDKIDYIKRKEREYLQETELCENLTLKTRQLEEKVERKNEQITTLKEKIKVMEGIINGEFKN